MKITEQFDDVETEYIPISKMGAIAVVFFAVRTTTR